MKIKIPGLAIVLLFTVYAAVAAATAFEGRINAVLTRGGEVQTFQYTVGTNVLRVERGESDRPYTVNLVNRDSDAITLLFPHNRSFVKLKPAADMAAAPAPGAPPMMPPAMPAARPPPGRPATSQMPLGIGPQPGGGGAPATMPAMPMMPMDQAELTATTDTTNLLGYACTRYILKQRGEVMEIWATDKLLPFQAWLQNQPPRFGPRMMEEQWGEMLKAKKLFPLLAVLKFENGPERLRFEVRSVTPEALADQDGSLFQPPADYHELDPLPF